MKYILGFILFIVLPHSVLAEQENLYYFHYDKDCAGLYKAILDLDIDETRKAINARISDNEFNLAYYHIASYTDFFDLFISEDEDKFKRLVKNKDFYISKLEMLSDEDPYKDYAIAEITLHWAIIRSKFGELLKSSREIIKAYKRLESNKKAHPEFSLNNKSLSIIHALIETVSIPGIIKKFFGLKGSILQAEEEIESTLKSVSEDSSVNFLLKECEAIYLYLLMHQLGKPADALEYMSQSTISESLDPLSIFMTSKILQKTGQNDKAKERLESTLGKAHLFPHLRFEYALCLLKKLDAACIPQFESFIKEFSGLHYIKEAHQKLAWAHLIFQEDLAAYKYHMGRALIDGEDLVDGDKQAELEAEQNLIPSKELLQARLLFDGGYYQKAYALLVKKAYQFTGDTRHTLEFNYRMGRLCHRLNNYPEAISFYNKSIENESGHDSYYAANASLQIGIILESQSRYTQAIKAYSNCLKMNPSSYKQSIHQKAKTGILRTEERRVLK